MHHKPPAQSFDRVNWDLLKPGKFYILTRPVLDDESPGQQQPFFLVAVTPSRHICNYATITVLVGEELKWFGAEAFELTLFELLEDVNEPFAP